jgi:hypothetical protein
MAKPRYKLSFDLNEDGHRLLETLVQRSGLTQTELATRTFGWLAQQPSLLQAIVLGQIPDNEVPDVLALVRAKREAKSKTA